MSHADLVTDTKKQQRDNWTLEKAWDLAEKKDAEYLVEANQTSTGEELFSSGTRFFTSGPPVPQLISLQVYA